MRSCNSYANMQWILTHHNGRFREALTNHEELQRPGTVRASTKYGCRPYLSQICSQESFLNISVTNHFNSHQISMVNPGLRIRILIKIGSGSITKITFLLSSCFKKEVFGDFFWSDRVPVCISRDVCRRIFFLINISKFYCEGHSLLV